MAGVLTPEFETAFGWRTEAEDCRIDCDPQLVEAAVSEAVRGSKVDRGFQLAREACYGVRDIEARDRAFAKLYNDWFVRLRLADPVLEAIAQRPSISARTARRVLAPAIRRQDECAELYGNHGGNAAGRPYLVLRLRPESFGYPEHIARLLRHELMHIEDMLDPAFGYDPTPSQFNDSEGVPALIRDRYCVLWDTYIDGRLYREGRAGGGTRGKRLEEFGRAFPMLGAPTVAVFESVFDANDLDHQYLLECSRAPLRLLERVAAKTETPIGTG